MEEDGAIRYLGRDDDMLNAGGYRVSPLEIERVFDAHPGIAESAAVELPVREGVSVIALFYVPAETPLDEELAEAHAERIWPATSSRACFLPATHCPRGANNKLNRRALRDGWKG
jgi:acyl-coenzyme A synthetase/AMP-(fatty) acid ligase